MLILLSPSKTLNADPSRPRKVFSKPEHLDRSQELMQLLQRLSKKQLRALMDISDKLASQVEGYVKNWKTPFTDKNSSPSMLTFQGDVYEGLSADRFKARDLDFAQQHLRILSGLYGVLRPLDRMQPYRLEMGCPLARKTGPKGAQFDNLYQFWDSTIRSSVTSALADQNDPVLINLASNEYFKAVQARQLEAQIVTPVFKDAKNGSYKVISFFAKKARGQLARFILLNRLKKPGDLRAFDEDGYSYNRSMSTASEIVFTRG